MKRRASSRPWVRACSTFKVGDHASVFHHVPCGACYYCRKKTFAQCPVYKNVGCTAGFEPSGGGFAEYVRVMDWIVRRGLVKIPADVPFEQAAFIEPLNTTYKGVRSLHLQPDETVLVIGQGPIGILLATLARRTGAKVVTSDLYPQRHSVARTFGLEYPIDASAEDVVKRIREESEGRGADAVLLAVGGNALIRTAIDAARPGGRDHVVCADTARRGHLRSGRRLHGREDVDGIVQLFSRDSG